MLTIYGRPNSSNCAKVFWLLEELGIAHQSVPAGTGFGPTDTAEFRALNPFGKVPVLVEGETVLWESNAILRYLASRHGAYKLWPSDPAGRARVDRWMDWGAISFVPPLTRLRKARAAAKSSHQAAEGRNDAAQNRGPSSDPATSADLAAVLRGAEVLEQQLASRDFLAENRLTLADVALGAAIWRAMALPELAASYPYLTAYIARLEALPGFRRHIVEQLG